MGFYSRRIFWSCSTCKTRFSTPLATLATFTFIHDWHGAFKILYVYYFYHNCTGSKQNLSWWSRLVEKVIAPQLVKKLDHVETKRSLCVHVSPALIPILSKVNPVNTNPSCFSKIRYSPIHLRILTGLFPSCTPTKNLCEWISLVTHTCHMPLPFLSSWLDYTNSTW
jgi:hypothetical protein